MEKNEGEGGVDLEGKERKRRWMGYGVLREKDRRGRVDEGWVKEREKEEEGEEEEEKKKKKK
jgi:hypothetical protein